MMDNYKPKMVVGTTFEKLKNQKDCGNAWGDWDPEKFTVEDAAFGFIVMENGATIMLESSWALNIRNPKEAITMICGTEGGADMFDGLNINFVKNGRQCVLKPDLDAGGVAFYDGDGDEDPSVLEARAWLDAVINDREPRTKASQALVVTQILEAIYESAKTGKPIYLMNKQQLQRIDCMRDIEKVRRFFEGDRYAVEVTGVKIDEVDDCYSKCSLELDKRHYGAHGQVMGGVMFTLADFAFAVATNTSESFTATADSHISYLTSTKGKKLFAECRKVKEGRKLCFYEITITDDLGAKIAVISTTGFHI